MKRLWAAQKVSAFKNWYEAFKSNDRARGTPLKRNLLIGSNELEGKISCSDALFFLHYRWLNR